MLTSFFDEPFETVSIDLRLLELPMATSLQAAHGSISHRELTVISLETSAGKGWGECSALTSATYGTASARQCFEQLRGALPQSFSARTFSDVLNNLHNQVAPLAYAAIEMAMLDIALRTKNVPLKQWLGANKNLIQAGAVLGLPSANESPHSRIEQTIAEGYKRIKFKVDAQTDLEGLETLAATYSDIELHVDANGSFKGHHSKRLLKLFDAGFLAIEQPFSPEDIESAQSLTNYANKHNCFVIADEAADSLASIYAISHNQAANAISVKSGRLGGLVAAQAVQQLCLSHGLDMVAGGMLESGLGRAVLATLAACEGFTLTGDVSPASRWLRKDPWQDLTVADEQIEVPDYSGIALPPNEKILELTTKQQHCVVI